MDNSEFNYDIGKTLLLLRTRKKYSQQFVADCLNMNRTTYHRCEQAGENVSMTVIRLAATLYCMSIEAFIYYQCKNDSATPAANGAREFLPDNEILMNTISQMIRNGMEMTDICKIFKVFEEVLTKKT